MTQLDLFAVSAPHVPEDDSPFCSSCRHFASKVLPLGKTGGWVGKAGDCSVHGQEVEGIATCDGFVWRSNEERERRASYLRKVGRG